jgi:hypothetical protein
MESYCSSDRATMEKLRNVHPQQNIFGFNNIVFNSKFDSGNLTKVVMTTRNNVRSQFTFSLSFSTNLHYIKIILQLILLFNI